MEATTMLRAVRRQVVVEAPRVEGKDLENEFESIASEGLEGHWVIR
jgi:hypothetical protein